MSPRSSDPATRVALIETGARLLSQRETLSARRLAAEVGTSTQAVYTHFGSMEELRRALRKEGFDRLADHMSAVELTDDPVADICSLGWAYCLNGLTNPDLYRVMFLEAPIDPKDADVGLGTFGPLITTVQRAVDAGRFEADDAGDPWSLALQLWTMIHGTVTLVLAETLGFDDLSAHLPAMARSLFVGFGDEEHLAVSSIQHAASHMTVPTEIPT